MTEALHAVQEELAMVDREMHRLIDPDNPFLAEAARYFLQAAGKKMRPALVLLAGKCWRETVGKNIIKAAVALEFLHAASLVHDDVIDRSCQRRGTATVNSRWDNRTAVLLGDYFYSKALGLAARCGTGVVHAMAELVECLVVGECGQWRDVDNLTVSEDEYYQRIERKTARFIAICCRLGALAEKAPAKYQAALAAYGRNLGMAYQIRDDMLDLIGDERLTGKPKFADLSNGHITLPVIHALAVGRYRNELVKLLNKRKESDIACWTEICRLLHEGGSINYTLMRVENYVRLAKECLLPLPRGSGYHSLCRIADLTEPRLS